MKIHPVVGAEILERVHFPYPVVPIVRAHHERWDGTGYPDGLKGEEIPIGARILSAVDCLDALATDRQYRKALPLDDAMQWVVDQAGKAYDPRIVNLLKTSYKELEAIVHSHSPLPDRQKLSTDLKVER
jgi:HD-GYP domain-containing protein (c-di-GMP phosphodiesterase class II)